MIKRLTVTKVDQTQVWRDFSNDSELNDYVEGLKDGRFGKPEHKVLISPEVFDEETGELLEEVVYETIPVEYTVEITDVTSEIEEQVRKAALKAAGSKARVACETVLDLISGHNLSSELTASQITTMAQTFGPLVQALTISRPSTAKLLIEAIEPDGVLITEQMKQDCLDELVDY